VSIISHCTATMKLYSHLHIFPSYRCHDYTEITTIHIV